MEMCGLIAKLKTFAKIPTGYHHVIIIIYVREWKNLHVCYLWQSLLL